MGKKKAADKKVREWWGGWRGLCVGGCGSEEGGKDGVARLQSAAEAQRDDKKSERRVKEELAKVRRKARGAALADTEVAKMAAALLPLGLRMERVRGDGNCLFRAVSDQLHGHEEEHGALRAACVAFLRENAEEFGAFVGEEDVEEVAGRGAQGFDGYLDAMEREGVWGGHVELHGLARALGVRVVVHQLDMPRWEVEGDVGSSGSLRRLAGGAQLHIAYLDGDHFDSVRLLTDVSHGRPPRRIRMTPTGAVDAATGMGAGRDDSAVASPPRASAASASSLTAAERLCLDACEGHSLAHVRAVLSAVGGDASAAVDLLLAESAARRAGVEDWSALPDDADGEGEGEGEDEGRGDDDDDEGARSAGAAGGGGAASSSLPSLSRKEAKKLERARRRAIDLAANPNPHLALSKREQRQLARAQRKDDTTHPPDTTDTTDTPPIATSLAALKI